MKYFVCFKPKGNEILILLLHPGNDISKSKIKQKKDQNQTLPTSPYQIKAHLKKKKIKNQTLCLCWMEESEIELWPANTVIYLHNHNSFIGL